MSYIYKKQIPYLFMRRKTVLTSFLIGCVLLIVLFNPVSVGLQSWFSDFNDRVGDLFGSKDSGGFTGKLVEQLYSSKGSAANGDYGECPPTEFYFCCSSHHENYLCNLEDDENLDVGLYKEIEYWKLEDGECVSDYRDDNVLVMSCADEDECTIDDCACGGSDGADCNPDDQPCTHTEITENINDDGCCSEGVFANEDNDCSGCRDSNDCPGDLECVDEICVCDENSDCPDDPEDSCAIPKCNIDSGVCGFDAIETCQDNDDCCPDNCDAIPGSENYDNDCCDWIEDVSCACTYTLKSEESKGVISIVIDFVSGLFGLGDEDKNSAKVTGEVCYITTDYVANPSGCTPEEEKPDDSLARCRNKKCYQTSCSDDDCSYTLISEGEEHKPPIGFRGNREFFCYDEYGCSESVETPVCTCGGDGVCYSECTDDSQCRFECDEDKGVCVGCRYNYGYNHGRDECTAEKPYCNWEEYGPYVDEYPGGYPPGLCPVSDSTCTPASEDPDAHAECVECRSDMGVIQQGDVDCRSSGYSCSVCNDNKCESDTFGHTTNGVACIFNKASKLNIKYNIDIFNLGDLAKASMGICFYGQCVSTDVCTIDSDCGDPVPFGKHFCSGDKIVQNYRVRYCDNPFCMMEPDGDEVIVEDCSDNDVYNVCISGVCKDCKFTSDCSAGKICSLDNECVIAECGPNNPSGTCPPKLSCISGECVECGNDDDCPVDGGDQSKDKCFEGICGVCTDNSDCPPGRAVCDSGKCGECRIGYDDEDCLEDMVCLFNPEFGSNDCVFCGVDDDCTSGCEKCVNNFCDPDCYVPTKPFCTTKGTETESDDECVECDETDISECGEEDYACNEEYECIQCNEKADCPNYPITPFGSVGDVHRDCFECNNEECELPLGKKCDDGVCKEGFCYLCISEENNEDGTNPQCIDGPTDNENNYCLDGKCQECIEDEHCQIQIFDGELRPYCFVNRGFSTVCNECRTSVDCPTGEECFAHGISHHTFCRPIQ
jgi:hypothetical protein